MLSFMLFIIFILSHFNNIDSYIIEPGPKVKATRGEVWPKPYLQQRSNRYYVVRPDFFEFQSEGNAGCEEFLQEAFVRYSNIIAGSLIRKGEKYYLKDENFIGYLDTVTVKIDGKCDDSAYPTFNEAEDYELNAQAGRILASTQWGVLRGLETFTQLIYNENDTLSINATLITDRPRFPHRGLLLDTSRHFIPVAEILKTLDAMEYNKLNVFHWHIVDDQSFPYKSTTYPDLSEKGAYHPTRKVYQQYEIHTIIEYARQRGIRVIPEFDTPGHTRSWGVAFPELLTACYDDNGQKTGQLGPMDPTQNNTYDFLRNLFAEVVKVFPDEYFHIGGDEVGFECWQSNPDITQFMTDNNIKDYVALETYFIQKLVDILNELNTKYLVWEEVFVNGVTIPNNTVVHVWRDNGFDTIKTVTDAGYYALLSSCWYLDHLESGGDWLKYYQCDPLDFNGENKNLVLGGEACMWAEVVNEYNLASRIWPRASAAAEKLWTDGDTTNTDDAQRRLEEHSCRLNKRGIGAQPPNGPGVCL